MFLACSSSHLLVFADHDVAAGAEVLHCLQAVHKEGQTEAGPEPRDAEDRREGHRQQAGLGGGPRGDGGLAARALDVGWLWPELRDRDPDHPDHGARVREQGAALAGHGVLVGGGQVLAHRPSVSFSHSNRRRC